MASASSPPLPSSSPEPIVVGIEADQLPVEDTDSSFGDDLESYTTSLKSSVLNYRYEHGRRYHSYKEDASYVFPNDDAENDRLDMYHHIMLLRADEKLHYAPIISNPQRILDLGCGTGIWAIDMGDMYPSAEILGNDLSPIQPSLVPPNVKFEVDDIEKDWVYSGKFDFIHIRNMACSLRDWPRLIGQMFQFTKPGGWVEFKDFDLEFYTSSDGEFQKGCSVDLWTRRLVQGCEKFGICAEPGPQIEQWVKDAGFVNVNTKILPIPTGTWPKDKKLKEVGAFDLVQFLDNLEGLTLHTYIHALGWTEAEVKVLCANLRRDFKNPKLRMQHNAYCVWAQKPE